MRRARSTRLVPLLAACAALVGQAAALAAGSDQIPRRHDGRPDLSGFYDIATLTPLQRPPELGDNLLLTPEEANEIIERERQRVLQREQVRAALDQPPPVGGAAPVGVGDEFRELRGAGNVGGYNNFWTDRGTDVFSIDGKFRTSIITDPANGRLPEMTAEARQRAMARAQARRPNDGTAWWLELDGPGPYDGPELRPVAERCLIGFGSTAGPPMLPVLYNNLKRIVQTDEHVMILIEMVHDARIVRLNSKHDPPEVRKWFGDSIGWWEGDTLVVDTTNFTDRPSFSMASENLHVVERFTRLNDTDLLYRFTVEDPTVWTEPWSGEYVWPGTSNKVYEYACHEGNYALGGILRGARLLEAETLAAQKKDVD